jgi:hypothetical protein
VLCLLGVAVLALHAILLRMFGLAWSDTENPPLMAVQSMRGRTVVVAPSVLPPAPEIPETQPPAPPTTARSLLRTRPAQATSTVRGGPPVVAPAVAVDPVAETPPVAVATLIEVPVYATRLPPPGRWNYRLQRGLAVGEAELRWSALADSQYELQLEGSVAGTTMLDWVSRGQIDAAGIAPERFALRRRGRDRLAVNFQREASKITFSGPTHELPLLPGAQDRLSWMLQLPAIVAAAPAQFSSGATVLLFVAGARGDGDVWAFAVQGIEMLGSTPALKLVREPRKLYDTRVEIWLDPADFYMPFRAVQTPTGGGSALELLRDHEAR